MSLAPSVATLYEAPLRVRNWLSISVSQSGQSTDLVNATIRLRDLGANTMAWVNTQPSRLAEAAQWGVCTLAGVERSVAATKSCVAQMLTGARFVGEWMQASAHPLAGLYADVLDAIPDALHSSCEVGWNQIEDHLVGCERLYVIGRGPSLAVASEMALKFKECCGIHAEVFSSAEVRHGPMAIADKGFHALILAQDGPANQESLELADLFRARGVETLVVGNNETRGAKLPALRFDGRADEMELRRLASGFQALLALPAFYCMIERLARSRGLDPDHPPHLQKVTVTR